jgi:hypothetical protein
MDAYTLKRRKGTNEMHLFKGRMTEEGCTSGQISVCGLMNRDDSAENVFACEEEQSARKKCAGEGRSVCSRCVSTMYTSYTPASPDPAEVSE